ncbi:MAG TPA: hypothetical protein VI730_02940 [Burkholderiales bacterium]|nr:hypothetical protein [Burkholderiales bacterium]
MPGQELPQLPAMAQGLAQAQRHAREQAAGLLQRQLAQERVLLQRQLAPERAPKQVPWQLQVSAQQPAWARQLALK